MAPIIRPIQSDTRPVRRTVLSLEGECQRFVVEQAGVFAGLTLRVGDVLVTGGRTRPGDVTVLVARGMGRPRVGTVTSKGLFGTHGEPCSTARWMAAGRLLDVERLPAQPVEPRGGQLALDWSLPQAA